MKRKVKVVYKNAELKPMSEKEYDFQDYVDVLHNNLIRIISDVEEICYIASDYESKAEWADDIFSMFTKTKHKLLDAAGEIQRLPSELYEEPE